MLSESQIQRQILDRLSIYEKQGKLTFIRNNSIATKIVRRDGSQGFLNNAKKGAPDIIVLKDGTVYGLEVKTATGKLSESQKHYAELWTTCGGRYFTVRSVRDVAEILFPE